MSSIARAAWREFLSPLIRRPSVVQMAALCHRPGKSGVEVLLVKSSRGRWILPKGWPIDGLGGAETAQREAWEEGGVRKGKVANGAFGSFTTIKRMDTGSELPCNTFVYPIKVHEILKDYPEAGSRDRKWVSVEQARALVSDRGLKDILSNFEKKHIANC